jgi:ribosomal protein S18 acetylase RimI-like enzyme
MTTIQELRPEDDLHDLIELSREFFEEYEDHHREFFKIDRLCDDDIVDHFSRSLNSADGATFIAILHGRTIGYITVSVRAQPSFYKIKKVGTISGLMVHKDHRRKGIANRLLAESIAFLEEKGVEYFTVYTATANKIAVKFYERNGMTPLHITMIGETGSTPEGLSGENPHPLGGSMP